MYEILKSLAERPEPFSVYTAADLCTDEYVSSRMLEAHLNPVRDQASRAPEALDRVVKWMETHIGLAGQTVTDLGCGPGLYAERMAMAFGRKNGMAIRIARFQNCYGPEGTWEGGREKAPAAICRKVDGQLRNTYSARSGQSVGAIGDMLDAETWLTADEARSHPDRLIGTELFVDLLFQSHNPALQRFLRVAQRRLGLTFRRG